MTEADFWKKIRRVWCGELGYHGVRVEASLGGVDPGTPDTNLSCAGHGAWIELKVWPEAISPVQVAWHIDALERGAGAFVWCWVGQNRIWVGDAEDYEMRVNLKDRPEGWPLRRAVEILIDQLTRRTG